MQMKKPQNQIKKILIDLTVLLTKVIFLNEKFTKDLLGDDLKLFF